MAPAGEGGRLMKSVATAIVLTALVAPCTAGEDGKPKKATELVSTTLTNIRNSPATFKGVSVRFNFGSQRVSSSDPCSCPAR